MWRWLIGSDRGPLVMWMLLTGALDAAMMIKALLHILTDPHVEIVDNDMIQNEYSFRRFLCIWLTLGNV